MFLPSHSAGGPGPIYGTHWWSPGTRETFLLMTPLVFLQGAYSLSLLRYVGALPRPNEVLALCLELLGGKVIISNEIARINTAFFLM